MNSSNMKYAIITGASRGIGEAIAKRFMKEGYFVFCLSRSANDDLLQFAKQNSFQCEYVKFDLFDIDGIEKLMDGIFAIIPINQLDSIVLINNAGTVNPIGPVEAVRSEEIAHSIQVNLTAPILLTSQFVSRLKSVQADKRVINISSGAGKSPYYGWSSYCSTKAGLDMFTRCVALEQLEEQSHVKIISLAPGIVDTEMQSEIRQSTTKQFPLLDRFIAYKEEGKLLSPDDVAQAIVNLMNQELQGGEIVDVRTLK